MGGVISSISDTFYPDNPKRKARAFQLQTDIEGIKYEFDRVRDIVNLRIVNMEARLNQLLKKHGYSTIGDLEAKVEQLLKGDALKEWKNLTMKIDRNNTIEMAVLSISGLATIATGVVAGGLVALGVIAGATAFSAMSVAGVALAVVGAGLLIWIAIDGAQERSRLQDAIRKLCFARVDAKQALEQLNVYRDAIEMIDSLLNDEDTTDVPRRVARYMDGKFKVLIDRTSRGNIVQILREKDDYRSDGAWRNEDPDVSYGLRGATGRSIGELTTMVMDSQSGVSARHIASSLISSSEIIMNKGIGAFEGLNSPAMSPSTRGGNLIYNKSSAPRILLQFDPDIRSETSQPLTQDYSLVSELGPMSCEVRDNQTSELWKVTCESDMLSERSPSLEHVRLIMVNLASSQRVEHIGVRLVKQFAN